VENGPIKNEVGRVHILFEKFSAAIEPTSRFDAITLSTIVLSVSMPPEINKGISNAPNLPISPHSIAFRLNL